MIKNELIYNLAILVAMSIISSFIEKRFDRTTRIGQVLQGLLFGITALIGMLYPYSLAPGLIFDGRSVVLSICAFFFGPIAGVVSSAMAIILRINIGGAGAVMGVSVITASLIIGLIFYFMFQGKPKRILHLYIMGLMVHLAMIALFAFLPVNLVWSTFKTVSLTVILVYPLATILIGKILIDQEENRRLIKELSFSQNQYQLIADNSADPIIILDLEFKHVFVSPAVEQMYGFTPEEYMNLPIEKTITQESVNKFKKLISDELNNANNNHYNRNQRKTIVLEEYKKDGSTLFVESTLQLIFDKQGVPEHLLFVSRDITAKKITQDELSRSKAILDDIVNTQPTGIYRLRVINDTINPATNLPFFQYDFFNDYYASCLNSTKEQLTRKPELITKFVHPDDLDGFIATNLDATMKQSRFAWEGRIVLNNQTKWIHLESVPRTENNNQTIWTGALIDITQSKEKEREIFEREDTFRRLFECSTDPILLLDETFFDCNESALRILGLKSKSELLGKTPQDISPKYQPSGIGSIEAAKAMIQKSIDEGHNKFEWVHLDSSKNEVYLEIMLTPIILKSRKVFHVTWRDISERKQNEDIIKRTNSELNAIIELNPMSIQIINNDGLTLRVNPAHTRLFGEVPPPDYNVFEDTILLKQNLGKYLESARRGETVYFPDFYYNTAELNPFFNDKEVWLRMVIFALYDDKGNLERYVLIHEDITEQRNAQVQLIQSEQNYREIFDNAGDAIFIHDQNTGEVLDVNQNMLDLYGFPDKELALKTPINKISAEEEGYTPDRVKDKIEQAIEQGKITFEWRSKKVNGELFWSEITLHKTQIGGENRILALIRDVSDRKRLEESIQKRLIALTQPLDNDSVIDFKELFGIEEIQSIQDSFAEIAGVASLITYPNGTPITKPSNFCKLCNLIRSTEKGKANCLHSDAVIGNTSDDKPNISHCLSAGLYDAGASIVVGGKHIANWLIGQVMDSGISESKVLQYADVIGADKTAFELALQEVPRMSSNKFEKIVHALHSFANELSQKAYQNILQARFISDKQKAQEEIMKLNAELEDKIQQRTIELQATMEELQESNYELHTLNDQMIETSSQITRLNEELNAALATKDKFFSIIAHDLRNPFVVLLNNAELIEMHYHKMDDATKLKKIIDIKEASNYTYTLLENLLTWARSQRGNINFSPQEYNVYDLLYRNYLLLKSQATNKEIAISINCSPNESVFCDKEMFDTIIRNLISNAIKFSRPNSNIEIGTVKSSKADSIEIYVTDNGIGITPEMQEAIFRPGSQITRKGTNGESSTGLGLLLCKEFVDKHNGTIRAEINIQSGTTFYFTLPNVNH